MCCRWINWIIEKNPLNYQMDNNSSYSIQSLEDTYQMSIGQEDDCLSLKFPEDNLFSTKEYSPNPIRVLLVGDRGVGKTSFVRALQSMAKGDIDSKFNEREYFPSRQDTIERIESTTGFLLKPRSMIDYIRQFKYSTSFLTFALRPHGKNKILVIEPGKLMSENCVKKNRVFEEIIISEYNPGFMPPTGGSIVEPEIGPNTPTDDFAKQFDKIIIMAEYPDICTMRSVQYWATTLNVPVNRTIVCVNKCDVEAISHADDFHLRKAYVMDHYSSQCPVEYISVKTGANLGFIYKYL